MSLLKRNINYDGLELDLLDALSADTTYKLQNDAKLRALEQNVPTYEHFRQLVNGAHLKPLEPKDFSKKVVEVNNKAVNRFSAVYCDEKIVRGHFENFPNQTREFYQRWKETNPKNKFNFLWNSRHSLVEIFVEIPTNILEEFLDTLMKFSANENMDLILELLDFIASCNRFQLAVIFMSDRGKKLCRNLFKKLEGKVQNNSTKEFFSQLAKKYQV